MHASINMREVALQDRLNEPVTDGAGSICQHYFLVSEPTIETGHTMVGGLASGCVSAW